MPYLRIFSTSVVRRIRNRSAAWKAWEQKQKHTRWAFTLAPGVSCSVEVKFTAPKSQQATMEYTNVDVTPVPAWNEQGRE